MASQTLNNQTISSTYQGILHAGGAALPTTDVAPIYDGSGQPSALTLGLSGNGAAIMGGFSCSGQLTAGEIRYTTTDSASGANFPLISNGNKTAVFGQITSNALIDQSPSLAGQYNSVQCLAINNKGLVTNIVGSEAVANAWVTFDGLNVPFAYVTYGLTVICTAAGHNLKQGNIITIKNASHTSLNGSFVVQSNDANTFTFANPNPTALSNVSGTGVVDITVKASYNVSSVLRTSVGTFKINFSKAFKNQNYVTVCGTKYSNASPTDLENLQANTVSSDKNYVVVRSFFITSSDMVSEYDNASMSVYCEGSNIDDVNLVPASLDNFINTNYHWSKNTQPGIITSVLNITPTLMATNKWNVVVIGSRASFNCQTGYEYMNSEVVVNGSTTSTMNQASNNSSNVDAYIYHVFYYAANQLKYANFHYSSTGWAAYSTNAWDKHDYVAASRIFNGLISQNAAATNSIVNEVQASPGNWLLNFLNLYSNIFSNIQSANVTLTTTIDQANSCYNEYAMFHNFVRYYTP